MELDVEGLRQAWEKERREQKRDGTSEKSEKVLGGLLSVSPTVASAIRVGINWAQPIIRRGSEDFIRTHGESTLSRLPISGNRAADIANYAAHAVGWGMTFYDELSGVNDSTKKYWADKAALKEKLSTVSSAYGGGLGALRGNEVLAVEQRRIGQCFRSRLMYDTTKLIASAPQAYIKMLDDNERRMGLKDNGVQWKPGESNESFVSRQNAAMKRMRSARNALTETIHAEAVVEAESKLAAETTPAKIEAFKNRNPDDNNASVQDITDKIREELTESIYQDMLLDREEVEKNQGKPTPEKDRRDITKELFVPLGALGSEIAKDAVDKRDQGRELKTTALDLIRKLNDKLREDPDARKVDGKPLETYIVDIFRTHQENMGEPSLGKRYKDRFDDYAAKEIAEAIYTGEMHPMALVNLVGERKIVKPGGKDVATRSEIDVAINEQKEKMPARFDIDPDEYIAEAGFSIDDVKATIDSQEGRAHDFAMSVYPKEVLLKAGYKDDEIELAYANEKAHMAEDLGKTFLDLATLSDEELKAANITPDEIKHVREWAEEYREQGPEAVIAHMVKKGEFEKSAEFLAANGLALAFGDGMHIGQRYEQAGGRLHGEEASEPEVAEKAEKDEEKHAGEAQDHAHHASGSQHKHSHDHSADDDPNNHVSQAHHEMLEGRDNHVNL